jgi:DNA repair exonuclease SbcCD ATPase subunit
MDPKPLYPSDATPTPNMTGTPRWWTDQHTSGWEKVKLAFQRDWEQTKADFSMDGGRELNQGAGDTIAQAAGKQPIPPLDVQTHPTDPKDAAKAEEKAAKRAEKEAEKASETAADAQKKIDDARAKLAEKIGDARTDEQKKEDKAREDIAKAQQSSAETVEKERARREEAEAKALREAAEARAKGPSLSDEQDKLNKKVNSALEDQAKAQLKAEEKIASAREDAAKTIAKQNEKIQQSAADRDAAMAAWRAAEQEARYGYGVRSQYADHGEWDSSLESKLQSEWDQLGTGRSWDQSKAGVHRGWNLAKKVG